MNVLILSINYWPEVTGIGAYTTCRAEYLAAAGSASLLPGTRDQMQMILDFCLLGRGIYELRYHLVNHPERCHIPLRSMLNLLRQRDERRPA